jgi:Right handed beta helix region
VPTTTPPLRRTAPSRSRPALLLGALCLAAVAAALAGSCLYADDPYYCEGMPNDYCQDLSCTSSAQCSGEAAVCDLDASGPGGTTGLCVQCTAGEPQACTGTAPICGDDHTCRACLTHADCASAACLPDGACGDDDEVAYVAEGASEAAPCTRAAPCGKLARALASGRPFLKVSGALAESIVVEAGRQVTLLAAPGARLTGGGPGAIVTVRDAGTSLAIYDLAISDAPSGGGGYGLLVPANAGSPSVALHRVTLSNNPAGGLSFASGALTVRRCTLIGNPGGGLVVSDFGTRFTIADSVIAYNGRALGAQPSSTGGVAITANTAGSSFERNTVVFNESDGLTFRGGVSCNAPLVTASGNLIFHNAEPDGTGGLRNDLTTQRNTSAACAFGTSLALATDPQNLGLRSPLIPPLDFHLTAVTPLFVRDAGGACTGVDLDGDARPLGAACDLGADEYRP